MSGGGGAAEADGDGRARRGAGDPDSSRSPGPHAAELAPLAGLYSSEEVGTTWRLVAEGDKLLIKHRGVSEDPLKPTLKDTFTHDGIQLTFQRGPKGEVTGFLVDAGRVKSLGFKREAPAS